MDWAYAPVSALRDGVCLFSAHHDLSTPRAEHAAETGGLSGAPVKPLSILALSTLRSLLPPSIPIIGCGGISSGADAVDFLRAGASLVQAYTAFGYAGVGFPRELKDEISQ